MKSEIFKYRDSDDKEHEIYAEFNSVMFTNLTRHEIKVKLFDIFNSYNFINSTPHTSSYVTDTIYNERGRYGITRFDNWLIKSMMSCLEFYQKFDTTDRYSFWTLDGIDNFNISVIIQQVHYAKSSTNQLVASIRRTDGSYSSYTGNIQDFYEQLSRHFKADFLEKEYKI